MDGEERGGRGRLRDVEGFGRGSEHVLCWWWQLSENIKANFVILGNRRSICGCGSGCMRTGGRGGMTGNMDEFTREKKERENESVGVSQ